jgi:outer membrane protein
VKRILTDILLIAAIGVLFFLFFYKSAPRVAYVSSGKLLAEYKGMIDAKAEYQKKAQTWQANIDTLLSGVKGSIDVYERSMAKMSNKERQLSEELIRTKQKQLQDYQTAMRDKAQQEDYAMTSKVLNEVNAFMEKYGKQKNYDIIFSANESGNIVFAEKKYDITEEVIKELNSNYTTK